MDANLEASANAGVRADARMKSPERSRLDFWRLRFVLLEFAFIGVHSRLKVFFISHKDFWFSPPSSQALQHIARQFRRHGEPQHSIPIPRTPRNNQASTARRETIAVHTRGLKAT